MGITSADVHITTGLPLTWVRSQREEQFVTQIVEAVEKALNEVLPSFLLSCIASFANLQISPSIAQNPISSNESNTENEEIDWDFIGKS